MSSMANPKQRRAGLLQGRLDMLILRTLLPGPSHGYQIGKHIQRTTNEFLQMQHGSLDPVLHRLEKRVGRLQRRGLRRTGIDSWSKNRNGSRWRKLSHA